jgi:predicted dinucleotide-binding enzyme
MKIGIIGAGHIGGTLARLWANSGHQVTVSSRHVEQLAALVSQISPNIFTGSVEEAAKFGEVVVLSIPLGGIKTTGAKIANHLVNKTVIDTMNPFIERDGDLAKEIIERFPSAKIVRAFSSIRYSDLMSQNHRNPPLVAVPFATDYQESRNTVIQLIKDAGFEPFDLGSLKDSKPQDPDGILFGKALTSDQIKELLSSMK